MVVVVVLGTAFTVFVDVESIVVDDDVLRFAGLAFVAVVLFALGDVRFVVDVFAGVE